MLMHDRIGITILSLSVWLTTLFLSTGDLRAEDVPANRDEQIGLTVVTFNVLVDIAPASEVPAWSKRKALCSSVLRTTDADLIGLQEPSPAQVKFLLDELPGYEAVTFKGYTDATLLFSKESFLEKERGHW